MFGLGPSSSLPFSSVTPGPPRPVPVLFPDTLGVRTQLSRTIPSYLYVQYADDDDLQAFVAAYNTITQQYVDWFNSIELPVYTSDMIVGLLLDWVATGLYGNPRPILPSGLSQSIGPYNTWRFNTLRYNSRRTIGSPNYYATSDDIFKRILTWNFLKGDGYTFNIRYLKRRIMRFLRGVGGTNPNIDTTYQISVTFGTGNQVNINILNGVRRVNGGALFNRFRFNTTRYNQLRSTFTQFVSSTDAPVLAAAIRALAVQLPFQYDWVVTIDNGPNITGFYDSGGALGVFPTEGYPTSDSGLAPGSIWSNGGQVTVVPGVTPDPLAPPVFYGSISPTALIALGGGNLPLISGASGSLQLWNNGGDVNIS